MSGFALGPAILFVPADRPERYAKAAERADAVIIDLEDAVLTEARPAAREAVAASRLDPERTIVRVNEAGSPDFAADLEALARTGYTTVMLPKAERPEQLESLDGYRVVALCETAAGVVNAPALAAAPHTVALMWGAEDLMASLGGTSSRFDDGRYRDVPRHARAAVRLAAGAHGKAAIDAVFLDLEDHGGLRAEALDAVASGFAATACIHPGQVPVIRRAYAPTAQELDWARRLLAAAGGRQGAFGFEGRMVDEVVLKRARLIAHRAGD
ncbi:HpcH/HpaI aldolase/citrate lyase family protein [Zafaria sp. Z1313]|uniref:HpcH/HpaI aldolase/citrate lyase family protein n=1 Tax=Zafaria sp. Z1313 TaxID=3423202 RepID=UPI003D303106